MYDAAPVHAKDIEYTLQHNLGHVLFRKKRKERFTLFSDLNESLLRQQPGAVCCSAQRYILLRGHACTSQCAMRAA